MMRHKTGVPKIIQDIQPIEQWFDQPSFDTYAKMDSLLFKTLNSQEKSEDLKIMKKLYHDDAICQCQLPSSRQLKLNRWNLNINEDVDEDMEKIILLKHSQ